MKKILVLTAACMLSLNILAQDKKESKMQQPKDAHLYCALLKDNGLVGITSAGKDITADVTLANQTIIKADGTILKKDGTQTMLQDGECIDNKGNISRRDDPEKILKEQEKTNKREDKMPPQ